ncbi:MAG: hypothetical protein AAF492_19905, partial [Verrucomicrobiota bacterium]
MRYPSVHALTRDIQRYLADEPIEARPPSLVYQMKKYIRRNQLAAAFTFVMLIILTGILAVSIWSAAYFRKQEQRQSRLTAEKSTLATRNQELAETAREERNTAVLQRYLADMRAGQGELEAGQISRLMHMLHQYRPSPGKADLRGWEWYFLLAQSRRDVKTFHEPHARDIAIDWHPSEPWLLSASRNGLIVRNIDSGEIRWQWERNITWSWDKPMKTPVVAWSRDGTRLAHPGPLKTIRIRRASDGVLMRTHAVPAERISALAWSPDSRQIAYQSRISKEIRILDTVTGDDRHVAKSQTKPRGLVWLDQPSRIFCNLFVADPKTGKKDVDFIRRFGTVFCSMISPDGRTIALGMADRRIATIDAQTGRMLHERSVKADPQTVCWSPDGQQLAAGLFNQRVLVLKPEGLELVQTLDGHFKYVRWAAFSPDSRMIATTDQFGYTRIWDAAFRRSRLESRTAAPSTRSSEKSPMTRNNVPPGLASRLGRTKPELSSDGRYLAAGDKTQRLVIWDVERKQVLHQLFG